MGGRGAAEAWLGVVVAAIALLIVCLSFSRPEPFAAEYRTYEDQYYGVPVRQSSSADGPGGGGGGPGIPCGPVGAECPTGMRCAPDGYCVPECGQNGECRGGAVCAGRSADGADPGVCVDNPCPSGQAPHPVTGVCHRPCPETGGCGPSARCDEYGLCACDDDPACTGGRARDPVSCSCTCPGGEEYDPGAGECRPADGDDDGGDDDGGSDDDDDDGSSDDDDDSSSDDGSVVDVEGDGDRGCSFSWPAPSAAALVRGTIMRLYDNCHPCRYTALSTRRMRHALDFEPDVLRLTEAGTGADGLVICAARGEVVLFRLGASGGTSHNRSWPAMGDSTILKEGSGSCGPAGRPPDPPGACRGIERVVGGMGVDGRFGVAAFEDMAVCGMEPIPFANTGLHDFNFVDDSTLVVRTGAEAGLCQQLCAENPRCDAVELTEGTCRMYHRPSASRPSVRPLRGTTSVLVRADPQAMLTRARVLRAMGDPADHGDAAVTPDIPYLQLRLWDQRSEEDGYAESLRDDGVHPEHEYVVTVEALDDSARDLEVTARWTNTRAKGVRVERNGGGLSEYARAGDIRAIRFTARRTGLARQAVWLEDRSGRRAAYLAHGLSEAGRPRGTVTTFRSNALTVRQAERAPAADMAYGQIVFDGTIAARETYDAMPSARAVMDALQLSGVYVTKSGAGYKWRPLVREGPDSGAVSWKSGGGGVLVDLAFPAAGNDSHLVVYAGRLPQGVAPLGRVATRSRESAAPPEASPDRYSPWFVGEAEVAAMSSAPAGGKRATGAVPGVSSADECASACTNAHDGGSATCNAFRVTVGGCELYSWSPDESSARHERWSAETAGIIYLQDERPPPTGDDLTASVARQGRGMHPDGIDRSRDNLSASRDTPFMAALSPAAGPADMYLDARGNRELYGPNDLNEFHWEPRVEFLPSGAWVTKQHDFPTYFVRVSEESFLKADDTDVFAGDDPAGMRPDKQEAYAFMVTRREDVGEARSSLGMDGIPVVLWNPYFGAALAYDGSSVEWQGSVDDPASAPRECVWYMYPRTPFAPIYSVHAEAGVVEDCPGVTGCLAAFSKSDNTRVFSGSDGGTCGNCETDDRSQMSVERVGPAAGGRVRIRARKAGGNGDCLCRREYGSADVDTKNCKEDNCVWGMEQVRPGVFSFRDKWGDYLYKAGYGRNELVSRGVDAKDDTRAQWRVRNMMDFP